MATILGWKLRWKISRLMMYSSPRLTTRLISHAKQHGGKKTIQYGELVDIAKQQYPNNEALHNAIPVSIGRKLDVIGWFCSKKDLPDVTSLAVNLKGECGNRYVKHTNPEEQRIQVSTFDWTEVQHAFDGFITDASKAATPRKRRKEEDARQLRSEFYFANRSLYPNRIADEPWEKILVLLIEGFDSLDAFREVLPT